MKEVAFKKYRKNLFHTVIYLKIPFYLYQPTFGRGDFFPFSFKIPYAYFLNGSTPKKSKKLHKMCYCKVRTLQTKSTMYKQCKQNSRDFVKKVLVITLDTQRFRQIDAAAPQSKLLASPMNWRFPEKLFLKTFFFGEHLRLCPRSLASSIPALGLERFCPRKGCPWPWPRIFFVSLALASSLVSSTQPPLISTKSLF